MRGLLFAVAAIALVGVAGWYGLHWIPADFGYELEGEFASCPRDDEPLARWLRSQPGVYLAHVQRQRVGNGWRVQVFLGITRNGWGEPPLPDLEMAAAKLGYRGASGRFHDSPR
jgi:hypothetical protein